jgi:hypothetical protein
LINNEEKMDFTAQSYFKAQRDPVQGSSCFSCACEAKAKQNAHNPKMRYLMTLTRKDKCIENVI